MKLWLAAGMVLAVALGIAGFALAQDQPATTAPTTAAAATTAPATTQASAKPINKKCPVSGDPVDPSGKTVVYKGQVIGFCCEDCVEPFKKNPEKYSKNIK